MERRNWKDASRGETVCYCRNVNLGTIADAVKSGCRSLESIRETTGACTGGNCRAMNPTGKCCSGDILELIGIYSEEPEKSGSPSCSCCG